MLLPCCRRVITTVSSFATLRPMHQAAALRVRGDSMTGDQIRSGDVALIREQATVDPGDIALFVFPDGTLTIKRHRRERGVL